MNDFCKVCTFLNYIEHFLKLASTITGCASISALVGISILIMSPAIALKFFAIIARVKKYKSIIKKKKTKHHKTVSLEKSKRHSIEVLISKALIDSVISDDEFVSINIILKEFDNLKEKKKHVLCTKKIVNISKRVY